MCLPVGKVILNFPFGSVAVMFFRLSSIILAPGTGSPVLPSTITPVMVAFEYLPYSKPGPISSSSDGFPL